MTIAKQKCRSFVSAFLAFTMLFGLCPTALANEEDTTQTLTFGVLSDAHYFPTEYNGTRAEDYQNQISGDLRLMGEGEALTTGAVDQMLEEGNLPSVLLVTGDLSSEGELASHEGFAQQMARLQAAGVTVLVIPGNHDLYNSSAMTFESDEQIKDNGSGDLWTTEADFRETYASMGYDEDATVAASNGTLASIEYYVEDLGDDGIADCQGGLSYLAVTNSGYAFLMIDTEIYTEDFNGKDQAWGNGKGMISDDLLDWIKTQLGKCEQAGVTVIAGMHHPLLTHNTTSETEFITDRVQIQSGDSGYTADVNNTLVKTLADAGLRWVFTGHMHENDIASYTTASGNTIYDLETGGLVAYPAPYRMVEATRTQNDDKIEEELEVSSVSVEQAAMNACLDAPNGEITNTEKVDVAEYMTEAMYGDAFAVKLIHRYADRYLDQLADVPQAAEDIVGIDLYETLFDALPGILSGEMVVDLGGSVGKLTITYSSEGSVDNWGEGDGVHLNPTSGVAGLLSSFTIRNTDIKTEVQSVLDQFEAKYIEGGELNERLDQLIVDAVNTVIVDETDGHTLEDLVRAMFQRTTQAGGAVELTAALLYNGKATGLAATKTVTFEKVRDALTVSAQTADGQSIATGVKINQDVTITVTGESGKQISYQVNGGEWQTYTAPVTVSVEDGQVLYNTYTFAYTDQKDQMDKQASFTVDISKVTPVIDGITDGQELPVNEDAPYINSITLPEGLTATVDDGSYTSGSDIAGGEHTLVLSDAYGNTNTLKIVVPQYSVSWETPVGGSIMAAQALNRMTMRSEATFTRGTAVTITATPDYGYRLAVLKVNGEDFVSGRTTTVMSDLSVNASFEAITDPIVVSATAGGQVYAENTKTNQDVTITAALQAGLTGTIEYSTDGNQWTVCTETITVPATETVNQTTYQFRIQGHEEMTASFTVDLLKKTPVIAGVVDGGTLDGNTITIPSEYTVFIDGSETAYVSGTKLESGVHTVHIQDAYGNTSTVQITVPAQEIPVTKHTVTVNGSYAQNSGAGTYAPGETVNISAGTRDGYIFAGWNGTNVTFANAAAAQTTFVMPDADVIVTAAWEEVQDNTDDDAENDHDGGASHPEADDSTTSDRDDDDAATEEIKEDDVPLAEGEAADFADVASDTWYADAVQYVYENGMMSGTSETTFSPNLTTTRGMIVTILYRLENEPTVTDTTAFTDVAADQYYANAVAWAAQNGIVSGIDATTFAPNNAITREQMAAILYRYAQFKGYDVSAKADLSVYTDAASVGAYATDAMAWANGAGLITGTSATTLTPAGQATRAQVATILMRFCEGIAK